MSRVPVLQIVDSLDLGGYERAAVNLANALPRERYESWLCATRSGGPLERELAPHVGLLTLGRRRTADWAALRRLAAFIRQRGIGVVHPHGPSLFLARAAAMVHPRPAVIWHAHSGRYAAEDRLALPYRAAVLGVAGVIAVNAPLLEWARRRLRIPASRSWYVPNIAADAGGEALATDLPGSPGRRIVCVGNLRPEKDHRTLLRAMAAVVRQVPEAHVLLAGAPSDPACAGDLHASARALGLERSVTFLGRRPGVGPLLRACDIGVLSSRSEGLPMALLEYGVAGLAVVATSVGQCGEVLDDGRAGILVPAGDDAALARALVSLLVSAELRAVYAERLKARVETIYSVGAVAGRVCAIYETALAARAVHLSGRRLSGAAVPD